MGNYRVDGAFSFLSRSEDTWFSANVPKCSNSSILDQYGGAAGQGSPQASGCERTTSHINSNSDSLLPLIFQFFLWTNDTRRMPEALCWCVARKFHSSHDICCVQIQFDGRSAL